MGLALVGSDGQPSPSLSDIPGMLRAYADAIEASDPGEWPQTVLWVAYQPDGRVMVGALGDNPSKAEVVGLLHLAAASFTPEPGEAWRGQ